MQSCRLIPPPLLLLSHADALEAARARLLEIVKLQVRLLYAAHCARLGKINHYTVASSDLGGLHRTTSHRPACTGRKSFEN